jgi:hypothetical protein
MKIYDNESREQIELALLCLYTSKYNVCPDTYIQMWNIYESW